MTNGGKLVNDEPRLNHADSISFVLISNYTAAVQYNIGPTMRSFIVLIQRTLTLYQVYNE